jgi:hypothetical protein
MRKVALFLFIQSNSFLETEVFIIAIFGSASKFYKFKDRSITFLILSQKVSVTVKKEAVFFHVVKLPKVLN